MAEKLYVKKSKSSGSSRSNGRKLYGGASSGDGGGSSEEKPDDKGKGLFDIGPIGAVRDALSSSGNLVLEALDKLDMPRAAIVAGAQELGDGFDKLIGNEEVRGGGRLVDTGFNWDDFRQNFNNRVGVGDIIEAAHPDAPHALKVAGGFAGDILTDPLTYLTMGATTATNRGISGSRLVFGDEAATQIIKLADTPTAAKLGGRESLESVADDVLRNGTGVLGDHPELARAIGLDGAGFNFRGHTIPGTGRAAARTSRAWGGTKRAVTSRTWGKLSPETRRLWERVPGYQRVVDATGSKAKGLMYINSSRNATRVSRDWGTEKADSFTQLFSRHADADWTEVRRIIEDGDLARIGRSTPDSQAAGEVADWLEAVRTEFKKLTGKDLPRLEDYFPRQLTEEAVERLQKKRKRQVGQASGLEARVLRKGEKFLGEELEVGSIDEIREIAQRVLGESKIELFLDDPRAIFNGYIKGLSREMRRHRFLKNLEDTGLLQHIEKYKLDIQQANNRKAYGELKRQTRRGDRAQRAAVRQGERAARLRDENQVVDQLDANRAARAELDSDLDGEAQLIDRLNREMSELEPEDVDDAAVDAATGAAEAATAARQAAEAQGVKAADDVTSAQAKVDSEGPRNFEAIPYSANPNDGQMIPRPQYVDGFDYDAVARYTDGAALNSTDDVVRALDEAVEAMSNPDYQRALKDYFSAAGFGPNDEVRVYRGMGMGSDAIDPSKGKFTNVTLIADRAKPYGDVSEFTVKVKDIAGVLDNTVGEVAVRRSGLSEVTDDITQLEARLADAKQVAAQKVDEAAEQVADIVDPDELVAAKADLAAKQKEFEKAGQLASDLRQTKKGVKGKSKTAIKLEDDAVMDIADDVDDFGDLKIVGPSALAMEQKAANKKRVIAILAAVKGDPKWGSPQVNQQIRAWHSQLDQLADWRKAKAVGAGVPEADLARLEAEAVKIEQIFAGMESQFGLKAPKARKTAQTVTDIPDDIDHQIVLAEAKQARVAELRDQAKAEVERLEAAIAKQGKAGPRSAGVVRNSLSDGNVLSEEVTRLTAELRAAKAAKKNVAAAKRKLAAAEKRAAKVQKLVEKARTVEAEAWATANALQTARKVSATDMRLANEELADDLSRQLRNAKAREKRKLERQAALASEAVRLTKAAEMHQALGDNVLAEVAKLESLKVRNLAESAEARRLALDAVDDMPPRLSMQQEQQLAEIFAGNLQEVARYSNLYAEPDVAEAINDFMLVSGRGNQRGSFMRAYDVALSRWKAQALLSSGYHVRNFMTAVYMNHLAGMETARWGQWRHFGKLIKASKKGDDALQAAIKTIPEKDGLRDAVVQAFEMRGSLFGERGVEGIEEIYATGATKSGVVSASVGKVRKGAERNSVLRGVDPTSSEFYGYRANFWVAGEVEKLARGPLFIDGLMKGMDPDAALQRVVKHHFDYSDLSEVERKYLKRIIPFYTWARNNVPVMVEYLARKPGGMMWYLHAKRNIEAVSEEDEVVPGYFGESGAIRTPFQLGGGTFYAAPDLPFLNLNDTFNTSQMLSQVTPAIKAPLEIQAGKKVFNDAPLTDKVVEAPAQWKWLMPLLKVTSGSFGLPTVHESEGRFFLSDKDAYKIEQAMPILSRGRRLLPSEKRYKDRHFTSVLSTVFGFGSFTNGERQQGAEMYLRELELSKALKRDKQIREILEGTSEET